MQWTLAALAALTLFASTVAAQNRFAAQNSLGGPTVEGRISDLLQRMTLDEKVGQLVQYSAGAPTGPGTGRADYRDQVAHGEAGSFLNLTGTARVNALQRIAVEQSRLKIPLLFGLDVIHGYRTIFPVPLAMASTWEPQLVERAARVTAEEASADGIRWTFSPMVDIARDARWGRIVEGAGEDPYLGSVMAAAYVRGYQGESLSNADSIAACAKHYVGYGAAEAGRDYNAVDLSERTLRQVYLPPFAAAVRAGAATVMSAFNTLNGVPATADAHALTEILRKEWGFQGLVVSDWQAVAELIPHGIALDGAMAAEKALVAGVDVDMESGLFQHHLAELVRSGKVPQSALDEAVRRVLRVKFALGLFDHPYAPEKPVAYEHEVDAARLELARTIAERSLVLLKNGPEGSPALPISPAVKTIALIGPLADSAVDMLGSWPGKGNAAEAVTLKAALEQRLSQSGGRLLYAKGTETHPGEPNAGLYPSRLKLPGGPIDGTGESDFADAVEAASQADVVIAALGENAAQMTGEAASRAHLGLPDNQEALLEKLIATGKPVVLIVFSGRPLALTWAAAHAAAIVEAWYPGMQAGPALVRTLFGDVNFSGKLTTSFPRSAGQEPLYYNTLNTGRPAAGIDLSHPPTNDIEKYVSRYIDEQNFSLFPFGFGLSYTHFAYSTPELSATTVSAGALNSGHAFIRVSATITNAGKRAGREIVQLYVGQRGTSVARPMKELQGFRIVELSPGESQKVEFRLGRDELAFWNLDMHYTVEPARVTVWIGPSSAQGQAAEFTITP